MSTAPRGLPDIEKRCRKRCDRSRAHARHVSKQCRTRTHRSSAASRQVDGVDFIILNPGGFTHTSVALRDALLAVQIPFIEIHLSNTFAREEFRHNSYFSDIASSCLFGFGAYGYELALQAADKYVEEK